MEKEGEEGSWILSVGDGAAPRGGGGAVWGAVCIGVELAEVGMTLSS